MNAKFSMICSQQSNGSYFAICPEVKGCFTQGDTYEQAFSNLKDLVETTIKEMTKVDMDQILMAKNKIYSEFELAV